MTGETRKLQKVGGGTYTVSIPKEWATEQSLSAGETVHLYPDGDGSLVVCRDGDETAPVSVSIAVDSLDGAALDRTLRAAYCAGIERLRLTATEEFADDRRRRIDRLVRERTGMRIVEEGDGSVTIRTILDDGEVSIPRTVVQLQFVTLSLFRTAVDLALDPGANGNDRIDERRADAARLASLVTRQFGRSLSRPATAVDLDVDRTTAFDCYRTARALDRTATLSAAIAAGETLAPDGGSREERGSPGEGRLDQVDVEGEDVDGGAIPDSGNENGGIEQLRTVAEGVRLYVEEATTAVVDGASMDAARDLRATRADLSTVIAETETAVVDPQARTLLDRFRDCADCGDRIAAVALEAAIRRDG